VDGDRRGRVSRRAQCPVCRDSGAPLAATVPPGSRRDAAKALDVAEGLITAALRRYPWLRRVYPERRGRKPAPKATDP